jgi:CTP synthase
VNPDTGLVEIVELEDHPFSSGYNTIQNIKVPANPHPIFVNFVAAAVKAKRNNFSKIV